MSCTHTPSRLHACAAPSQRGASYISFTPSLFMKLSGKRQRLPSATWPPRTFLLYTQDVGLLHPMLRTTDRRGLAEAFPAHPTRHPQELDLTSHVSTCAPQAQSKTTSPLGYKSSQ
eukprot:668751-Amphidinium_carterae.1